MNVTFRPTDTAIITRFHYPEGDNNYKWRFDYYKNEVLPRLLAQTDNDFDIWIWCEPWQKTRLEQLHYKIHTFSATYAKRDSHLFIDYTPYSSTEGLPMYAIQIGLDSDDLVRPNFIKRVHELCQGEFTRHISFQPKKYDIKTGKKYLMDQYTINRGSPIFAHYQPDYLFGRAGAEENFKFAYHTSHLRMPLLAQEVILVPEGLVFMSIHDLNDSTKIKAKDIPCT